MMPVNPTTPVDVLPTHTPRTRLAHAPQPDASPAVVCVVQVVMYR